jgi:hypothetical protein
MKNLLLYLISFVLILSSCVEKNVKENTDSTVGTSYRNPGFNADFMDSLMVDIITYVGKKHAHSTFETRFTPEFRNHYIEMADDFEMKEIILTPDSGYYFYMFRPARSLDPDKNKRGVLGKFRLDEKNKILDFQELVNTPPGNTETLLKSGKTLMSLLIEAGSVDSLLQDTSLVEWPDGRLYYDKQRFEWRYVDAE